MLFTPLLPGGVISTDTGTLRKQIKVKRSKQPQIVAQIDWSNPITRGLLRFVGDTSQGEAITRSPVTKNGTVTYNKDSGYKFAASSSVSLLDAPADNWTVFCLAYTYSAGEEVNLVNRMGPATSSYAQNYVINFVSGVTPRVGHKNLSGGTYSYVQSSITPPTNSLCAAAGTFNGSTINVYTNGVNGGSVAATSPLQVATGYITQIGAGDGADKVRTYKGRGIQVAAIWNRALTPVEIKSISDNPWQIFKSNPQTMVATKGIVSRPNSDLTVTNNTITIRKQIKVKPAKQPQYAATLNSSNPLTRHIVGYWTPTVRADVTSTNNPQQIVGKPGKGLIFVQASAQRITVPLSKPVVLTATGASILTICFTTNNLSTAGGFAAITDGNSWFGQLLRGTDGVQPSAGITAANWNGSNFGQWNSPQLVNNEVIVSVVTINSANTAGKVYRNGVDVTTNQPYSGALSTSSLNKLSIGTTTGGAGDALNGGVYLAVAFNKVLSPSEVRILSNNPWQIFESLPQTIVYTKPGVGGWTYNSNTSLYDAVDEPSYTDIDAIVSPNLNATPGPVKFGLDTSLDTGTYNVNVRARRTDTTGDIRATLIDSAGNVVGTSSWQTLTEIYQTYTLSVTTTATASRVGFEVRP